MLLRAPCPSPREAHAEARGGVGGQPAVAAAPRHAGGTRLLLEVQRQASPKMGFLNLCLHLRERSEMAAGAQRQQNRHPFPMVFIPSDFFFFFPLPNPAERDGSEFFPLVIPAWGLWVNFPKPKVARTGSSAAHTSNLPPHCKSSR